MGKMRFEELSLSEDIYKAIEDMGFEEMTPIQSEAIPFIMEGKDIIGQAQTGTGKTATFGIPIVEKTDGTSKSLQSLVLCPTRELSIQVAEEIKRLSKYKKDTYVLPVYGGQPIERQIKALKKGIQIVVGTPGRVIDHIKRKTLKLDNVNILVLDEADEMFDMGFRDDIEFIINKLPDTRQTVFFSATMPEEILNFAKRYQRDPEIIKVVPKELTVPEIEQYYLEVKEHMKTEILSRLLDILNPKLSLVFCNTKKKVDELTIELQGRGYFVDGLHGDLKQSQRDKVMSKFRSGGIDILVATDVAARGIDVDDVDVVFNYDLPQDEENYVHRIGRTARAGREGMAISFVTNREFHRIKTIERYTKAKIKRKNIPTLKDMEDRQSNILLNRIREEIQRGQLDKYEKMLNVLLVEDFTSFDIAACLLKFCLENNKIGKHSELDSVDYGTEDINRVYINVGKKKGVSSRHILEAIINEAGIPKKSIGDIDMFDKFTFVSIKGDYADKLVKKLNNKRVKGIKVKVELASPKGK
ncbi:MAG TPA: DEAD/DEAH box helicase [Tissierellia bacterium]|nr:DEAD/DEAH box helicase [Tissierellia bacterium]